MTASSSGGTVQPRSTVEGWVWCGVAGHFIGANRCRLHLHTRVGDVRISTVGDYYQNEGDDKPTEIGIERLYETFVFNVEGFGEHGEGDISSWSEIDSEGYMDPTDAERGHMAMCLKYDRIARTQSGRGTSASNPPTSASSSQLGRADG